MTRYLHENIDETIRIVETIPEEYRKIAFEIILNYFLSVPSKTAPRTIKPVQSSKTIQGIDIILNSDYDWSSTNIPNLKPSLQNLYILKIAKKDFGIDGLSPKDIQTILIQKFRLSKTDNAVSMSLMQEVGKHIDRIQEGKKFRYKITDNGVAYLDSEIKKSIR